MIFKPYPEDDEPRTLRVTQDLLDVLAARIADLGLSRDDLLFPSKDVAHGDPVSRATFNTRYWRPALDKAGIDFPLRMHDLRHAHASWLLAGGADLMSVMERMGHSQIMTTQKYLHTLPDADDKALAAFESVRRRRDSSAERRLPLPHARCGAELLALSKFAGPTLLNGAGIQV